MNVNNEKTLPESGDDETSRKADEREPPTSPAEHKSRQRDANAAATTTRRQRLDREKQRQ